MEVGAELPAQSVVAPREVCGPVWHCGRPTQTRIRSALAAKPTLPTEQADGHRGTSPALYTPPR